MLEKERFVDFVQDCAGFDERARLRLLLVGLGYKPATYVRLKITPRNLEDKHHFERHLREVGLLCEVSEAKGFEEMTGVAKGVVTWKMMGTWYGYDIFSTKKEQDAFREYRVLAAKGSVRADAVAGALYGYPKCCMKEYVREQDVKFLRKNFSYYEYFRSREVKAHGFALVLHTPCSAQCAKTRELNGYYARVLQAHAPKWFVRFCAKKVFDLKLLVESHADIYADEDGEESVWLEKDGHEYQCISVQKMGDHFVALTYLQRESLERGTIFSARVVVQHAYPAVVKKAVVGFWKDVHHERRFSAP